jgi:transcriptional regulator with XRE-family HTH domain
MARPTKFKEEYQQLCNRLAEYGLTDRQMSHALGVTEQTFNNWKLSHKEFFESLKRGKKLSDETVKRSLWERATGYDHYEDKIFNNGGEELVVSTVKHYPPDTTAAIFWLKNRDPEKWREKQEVEHKHKWPDEVKVKVFHTGANGNTDNI